MCMSTISCDCKGNECYMIKVLMMPCFKISGLQLCTEKSRIFINIAFFERGLILTIEHAFKVSIKKCGVSPQ